MVWISFVQLMLLTQVNYLLPIAFPLTPSCVLAPHQFAVRCMQFRRSELKGMEFLCRFGGKKWILSKSYTNMMIDSTYYMNTYTLYGCSIISCEIVAAKSLPVHDLFSRMITMRFVVFN